MLCVNKHPMLYRVLPQEFNICWVAWSRSMSRSVAVTLTCCFWRTSCV